MRPQVVMTIPMLAIQSIDTEHKEWLAQRADRLADRW